MNPLMQAIMQILQSNNAPTGSGGLGPEGSFSTDPPQEATQLGQVGQSLPFPSELSPTGANPGYQGFLNSMKTNSASPMLGANPLGTGSSGMNSVPAGQGHPSAMAPPTPQSLLSALGQAG